MKERKAISTRTRFEIFKRDFFTCQYCGRKPPTVVLHVDHIIPVSGGGSSGRENLITSCQPCNSGKSNVPLGKVLSPIEDQIKTEKERMLQMRAYNESLKAIRQAKDADFRLVSDSLLSCEGEDTYKFVIAGPRASTVKMLLERIPAESLLEAVSIADSKFSFRFNQHRAWKYFCGVCWRMVDRIEGKKV